MSDVNMYPLTSKLVIIMEEQGNQQTSSPCNNVCVSSMNPYFCRCKHTYASNKINTTFEKSFMVKTVI